MDFTMDFTKDFTKDFNKYFTKDFTKSFAIRILLSFCCQKMEKTSATSEIGTISYDGACIKTDLLYAALVLQPSGYQASPPTCIGHFVYCEY